MQQLSPILLVQLLGTAFACGLNLYATVAVLGLGSMIGFLPALPPGLQGLAHPLVLASALLLYVVEAVIDKFPDVDPLTVRFTDLRERVLALDGFSDDPKRTPSPRPSASTPSEARSSSR